MGNEQFRLKLMASNAALAMPGLGYDTYRLWETLASGAMPVLERGQSTVITSRERAAGKLLILLMIGIIGCL
jgi:hypothetical protein